ncbi:glycerol-3-phosphate 1-O-acyltransferase PlsY [Aliikangiella coralliicola]|uniref:Glycerol-3-phosphate acyltransferase n=1 Tax=Aliikangiella coralliicola TaxID=2592383 RepID=A0A545UE17_9GAMM|nr:glycerol-3-phosphate 1-O-acyltransferase PlsY [Aliikangiella coralliicola]TQV87709.1 glycerol-3-phosphate 1-O-acyltransferase PlsY [Aliikangiella coralliicola]
MDLGYFSLLIIAYLFGSISSAIIVCKLLTLPDPRIVGSHNPGATNVLRIGGTRAAVATLVGDVIKTALPLLLAAYLDYSSEHLAWIGVCALLGHCFPLYFSFKGGKGVASMMAVITLVIPPFCILAIGSWLISAWTFRKSSVASLITAIIIPIFTYQFYPQLLLALTSLSVVVLLRHRINIVNIIQGKEPLIGENKNNSQQNP